MPDPSTLDPAASELPGEQVESAQRNLRKAPPVNPLKNIFLMIPFGHHLRDHVRLGMLNRLLELRADCRVIILTPAYMVPELQAELAHERVVIERHERWSPVGKLFLAICLLRSKVTSGNWPRFLKKLLIRFLYWAEVRLCKVAPYCKSLFERYRPVLVVSTLPHSYKEYDVLAYAARKGVATAAVVKSWDNLFKGLNVRAECIAVWSEINRGEAITREAYENHQVTTVGPFPFDRYFRADVLKPRDEFWRSMGFDPARPVVVYGSTGGILENFDESFMMDELLTIVERERELESVQIVCRLHPSSRIGAFWRFQSHPRVKLSFPSYVKVLGWSMTIGEVDELANMLGNADLVITPASTLTLEAAVFDTPTIVSAFSTVQPETFAETMHRRHFSRHFQRLEENSWVPIVRSSQELADVMKRALRDKRWFSDGRRAIVDNYVAFQDGKSGERVANFISDNLNRASNQHR